MAFYNNVIAGAAGAGDSGYEIERSLLFNSSDSAYLNRTPSTAGNRKTWTWSGWVKRSGLGAYDFLFMAQTSGSLKSSLSFWNGDYIRFKGDYNDGTARSFSVSTNAVFRDPSAWYHVVCRLDTTQATAADRIKIWVNGVEQTVSSATYPTQNSNIEFNNTSAHLLGSQTGAAQNGLDGYLADVHFIDGQALAATDFGEYDDNNVWQPKEFSGTYGPLVNQTQNWSSYGDTNDKTNEAWEDIFDGNGVATPHMVAQSGQTAVWTPTTAISFTKLELYANNDGVADITLNGSISTTGTIPAGGGGSIGWADVTSLFTTKSLSSIEVPNNNNSDPTRLGAIRIDGKILVDSTVTLTDNSFSLDFSDNSSNAALGTDSSGNNNDWTANNLVAESPTALSAVGFDGDDHLSLAYSSDFVLDGDFTIEYFVYWESGSVMLDFTKSSSYAEGYQLYNQTPTFAGYSSSGNASMTSSSALSNGWNHVAVTRTISNNTARMFINGVQTASSTSFSHTYGSDTSNVLSVGAQSFSGPAAYFTGKISNLRILNGTALYTANFTVPTTPLTNIADTVLLCCQSSSSTTAATVSPGSITPNGDPTAQTFSDSSSANDSLLDSPTNYDDGTNIGGNYCTLNPLAKGALTTLSNGNLNYVGGAANQTLGTIGMTSGKFYWEDHKISGTYGATGIALADAPLNNHPGQGNSWAYNKSGQKWHNGSATNYGASWGSGDTIGVAFDADAGTLTFYKNGVSQGVAYTGLTNGPYFVTGADNSVTGYFNFGASGSFAYTPPTGFKPLCTQSLDDPLIEDPSTAFDVALYTGDGTSNRSITGLPSPDFVWIKSRSGSTSHVLLDAVRGPDKILVSNSTLAESTVGSSWQAQFGNLDSFDSAGFTVTNGTDAAGNFNSNNVSYAAWAWDGGDLVTNSAYNQSQAWSTFGDSNAKTNENWTRVFDGNGTAGPHVVANSGSTTVWTPSTPITFTKLEIYANNDGYGDITLNGSISTTGTVPSGGGSSIGWANVTSLISNNTLTSIEVPNSYNSDPTRLGAIKVDDKYLVDPGVIPVGSLNSSFYNQDQVWSTYGTFTGSYFNGIYDWEGVFSDDDYYGADGSLYVAAGGTLAKWVLTSSLTCNSEFKFYCYNNTTITLNEGLSDEVTSTSTGGQSFHYHTIPFSGQIQSVKMASTATYLIRLFVDGKALIDNGITMPNVPSISSTVRANPTAGFSITKYQSNGAANSIGHGLSTKPSIVFFKPTSSAGDWFVYTDIIDGSLDYLKLNSTDAKNNSAWTDLLTSTSVLKMNGSSTAINSNGVTYIAYCFAPVEGYSAVGSFVSNNSTDGPFVYLGFQPKLIGWKNADASHGWYFYDDEREPSNPHNDYIELNSSNAEGSNGGTMDILSNGFKVRNTGADMNRDSHRILYFAWAEHPFKTARAR